MKNALKSLLFFCGLSFARVYGQVPIAPSNGSLDGDKNWILTRNYDDQGNIVGTAKNFFDNSGKVIQTQFKNMTYGHVMANQPIQDALGRNVAQTLVAPINNSDFRYKADFVLNGSGGTYDYKNFDRYYSGSTDQDKTNSPDPVGGQTQLGTLGWYYSDNNNWEPFTATSSYPYSRTEFFTDGSGAQKKKAGVGEAFRMGATHETFGYVVPVSNELDFYLQVMNKFFPLLGDNGQPFNLTSLKNQATQEIVRDVNGKLMMVIKDKGGRELMNGLPGSGGITASNSVVLDGYAYTFKIDGSMMGMYAEYVQVKGGGNGRVKKDGAVIYSGPLDGYLYNLAGGITGIMILEGDQPFTVAYNVQMDPITSQIVCKDCSSELNTEQAHYYFAMLASGTVTVSGGSNFQFIDQATEQLINPLPPGQTGSFTLPTGYYRLLVNSGETTLSFSNSYKNSSFNFYNQRGQHIASIAPEGVKLLLNGGINNYATKADLPFTSLVDYDQQGRVMASQSADRKKSNFLYRKDGRLRFSQNPEQQTSGRFSYTNYDQWGRPIESGEFQPTGGNTFTFNSSGMLAALESIATDGGFLSTSGTKADWIKTKYDVADNTHGQAGYTQDEVYLNGAVSMTEGPDSKTWYSYSENGKVVWVIKWVNGLGYKTMDYTYDPTGKLTKIIYQNGIAGEKFVHFYTYDADQRLTEVRTNTIDDKPNSQLQAKYIYYLQGGIRRVEIGGNLQGIDYTYTIDGKLKAINHSDKTKDPGHDNVSNNNFLEDAFGETLEYYPNDYVKTGSNISSININTNDAPEQYGGQIRGMSWFSKKPPSTISESPTMYVFKYDDKYQYSDATWGSIAANSFVPQPGVNKETVSGYDLHGNITGLSRTDGSGTTTDNFLYTYLQSPKPTDQLASITQQTTSQLYASYEYNGNGQLTKELPGPAYGSSVNKYPQYDLTGKVKGVYSDLLQTTPLVKYVYDEMGKRIKKLSYNSSGVLLTTTYYVYDGGGVLLSIYEQPNGSGITMKEVSIRGGGNRIGIYFPAVSAYRYEMIDHLGNVRAVFVKTVSGGMDMVVFRDYYPFGMPMPARVYEDATGYRYGYQGKYSQKDPETNWNAFDLRMYDSRIGRWLTADPAGQFYSPYVGMGNDPVNGVDPNGAFWEEMRNFFGPFHKWMSNAALVKYLTVKNDHYIISDEWIGDRRDGHGVLKYTQYDENIYDTKTGLSGGYRTETYTYAATYDHIFNLYIKGKYQGTFEHYFNYEENITFGLQSNFVGGFINLSSITLYKRDFLTGKSWFLFNEEDNHESKEWNMGVSIGGPEGAVGVSATMQYDNGYYGPSVQSTSLYIDANIMGLGTEAVHNLTTGESETRMGFFDSGGVIFAGGIKAYDVYKKSDYQQSDSPWGVKFRDVRQ